MVDFPAKAWRRLFPLPDLRQEEPAECAAVVLALALRRFGRREPLDRLRSLCRVSRHGASALDLARAAEACGLTVLPVRAEADAALSLPPPVVALMEEAHFVLITGADARGVLIADPATGPRRLERAEFARQFSGVALALQPGPGFRPGGEPPWRFDPACFDWAAWRRRTLHAAATVPAQAAAVWLTAGALTDGGLDGAGMAGRAVAVAVLWGGAGAADALLEHRWRRRDAVRLGAARLDGRLAMAVEGWERHHPAALAAGIAEAESDTDRAIARARRMGQAALAAAGIAAVGPQAPTLAGLAAASLGLIALSRHLAAVESAPHWNAAAALEGERHRLLLDWLPRLGGAGAGQDGRLPDRASDLSARSTAHHRTARRWQTGARFAMIAILAAAAGTAAAIEAAIEDAPAAALLPALAALPLLAGWWLEQPVRSRLRPAEEAVPAKPAGAAPSLPARRGVLLAEGVAYARPGAAPCLHSLGLRIGSGERVALVGASGSGKTTLIELLAGLRSPAEGSIMLDGEPVDRMPDRRRAALIGLMAQEVRFLDASVRANLAGLDEGVPEDSLTGAARSIGIHERIARRRAGYQSSLGRDGAAFSGGERALLELARLLALRPPLLLLDEPTAALDPAAERTAWDAVLDSGAGVLVATHSPMVAAACYRCLLLEDGRIIATGTHAALMAAEPRYRALMGEA